MVFLAVAFRTYLFWLCLAVLRILVKRFRDLNRRVEGTKLCVVVFYVSFLFCSFCLASNSAPDVRWSYTSQQVYALTVDLIQATRA